MNEKRKLLFLQHLFFAAIVAAILASIFAIFNYGQEAYGDDRGEIVELSTGWQYETGSGRAEIPSLPAPVPGSPQGLTLYYRLPEELPDSPVLEFISRQTSVEVLVDGVSLYRYGMNIQAPVGSLLGNARNEVALPRDAGGKEVEVRFASPYVKDHYRISSFFLGCHRAVTHKVVASSMDLTIFILFSVFFCLQILFTAAFFRLKKTAFDGTALIYFTLFIFISTTWVITDSNILQMLTPNFPVVYFISHLAFMLIPLPLIIFLRKVTHYRPQVYGALLVMYTVGFFVRLFLFFAGIADLETTLFLTHILMGGGAIVCIATLWKEWRLHREKTKLMFLVGFISLAGCLLISLALFMFSNQLDYSLYFRIMLILMMGAMFYEIFSQLEIMVTKGIETQLYQKLAYTDSLTGILNRLAFQEEMTALQNSPDCRMLTVVIFDINHLKHTNDTFGHSAGDDMIQNAARNIQHCFGSIGKCYRIGGDEFAVLLKDFPESTLKETLAQFQKCVAETPLVTREQLHIAAGYATGPTEGERFAYHLFDRADRAMYQQKADQNP